VTVQPLEIISATPCRGNGYDALRQDDLSDHEDTVTMKNLHDLRIARQFRRIEETTSSSNVDMGYAHISQPNSLGWI
jgi:hypothetical protein